MKLSTTNRIINVLEVINAVLFVAILIIFFAVNNDVKKDKQEDVVLLTTTTIDSVSANENEPYKEPEVTTTVAPTTVLTTTTVLPTTVVTTIPETTIPPTTEAVSTNVGGFLDCVRERESRGDYGAVNSSSGAGGAYQFMQRTWDNTARNAGREDLVGIHPSNASPADQDAMANHLLNWQGTSPWAGGNYGC